MSDDPFNFADENGDVDRNVIDLVPLVNSGGRTSAEEATDKVWRRESEKY